MVGTCKSLTEKVLTSVPRSNEHTEHTGAGMAAGGTGTHIEPRKAGSVERRATAGGRGDMAWGTPPLRNLLLAYLVRGFIVARQFRPQPFETMTSNPL